jgi:aldose 1-epimerase
MSTHYATSIINDNGFTLVTLSDSQGRAVKIAPSAGFNAYSFRTLHDGGHYEVFVGPQSDEALHKGGFGFGCPILFPFPNRTRDGRYQFDGQVHQLDATWKDGNAIHGLVHSLTWTVVDSGASDEQGAWVTASISTNEYSNILRQYPFECELRVTYSLHNAELHLNAEVINRGEKRLPMGFGIHPWFPAPLTRQGKRSDCVLTLPARGRWELESDEQLIPTGHILPLSGPHDFSEGQALNGTFLDDVFTQLIYSDEHGGEHITTVLDEKSGLRLEVRASGNFREHVVFAPLDQDVICLEPYTMTTNFVNLSEQGIDAGLVVLEPGAKWAGSIIISCRDL